MKNLLFLALLFCSLKSISQNADTTFVYENNGDKVILSLDNGKDFLMKDKFNPIKINTENIDIKTLSLSGMGLRFPSVKSSKENELLLEIILIGEKTTDPYIIHFSYKKNGEFHSGKFEIPIKKS